MKTMFFYALVAAALPACMSATEQRQAQMQAEHAQRHEQNCLRDYESHVKGLRTHAAELRDALPRAERAEWQWAMDCDACDENLLPKPLKLGSREFAELKEVLAQAVAMPPLPQDAFMTPVVPLAFTEDGQVLEPMLPVLGCCGGVFIDLVLLDAAGNALFYVDEDDVAPASAVSRYMHKGDTASRPQLLLPDAAYARFQALPSCQKARAVDAALRKKLKH